MHEVVDLPIIEISQVCSGCSRVLPLNLETFAFCLLCNGVFCHKCMRACIFCQRERCYICMERITDKYKTSGEICEKCAQSLRAGARSR